VVAPADPATHRAMDQTVIAVAITNALVELYDRDGWDRALHAELCAELNARRVLAGLAGGDPCPLLPANREAFAAAASTVAGRHADLGADVLLHHYDVVSALWHGRRHTVLTRRFDW
jgi:hypothetical protein